MLFHRVACAALICLCVAGPARADDSSWSVLGGYGATHVGMGLTREHVETGDIVLRYERVLVDDMGASWYKGRHDLLVELPASFLAADVPPMIAVNFLASYFFSSFDEYEPYIFLGGGPVYIAADIPGMGSRLNGNYQTGMGVAFKTDKDYHLIVEYRFHHISNAGAASPNVPLNSSKLLVGITFLR